MNDEYVIDFNQVLDKRETALVGREHGESILAKLKASGVNFDELENNYVTIKCIIPDNIVSINKSFFLGMFELVIQRLGKNIFCEKYSFITTDHIKAKIDRHIDAALLNATQGEILNVKSSNE